MVNLLNNIRWSRSNASIPSNNNKTQFSYSKTSIRPFMVLKLCTIMSQICLLNMMIRDYRQSALVCGDGHDGGAAGSDTCSTAIVKMVEVRRQREGSARHTIAVLRKSANGATVPPMGLFLGLSSWPNRLIARAQNQSSSFGPMAATKASFEHPLVARQLRGGGGPALNLEGLQSGKAIGVEESFPPLQPFGGFTRYSQPTQLLHPTSTYRLLDEKEFEAHRGTNPRAAKEALPIEFERLDDAPQTAARQPASGSPVAQSDDSNKSWFNLIVVAGAQLLDANEDVNDKRALAIHGNGEINDYENDVFHSTPQFPVDGQLPAEVLRAQDAGGVPLSKNNGGHKVDLSPYNDDTNDNHYNNNEDERMHIGDGEQANFSSNQEQSNNNNNNNNNNPCDETANSLPEPSLWFRVLFFVLYSLVFVVGFVGNALTLYAMLMKRGTNSVIDIFIANLALSDIMLCIFAVPITPVYSLYFGNWVFGTTLCKMFAFAMSASVYISTFTMINIAFIRFRLIVYPHLSPLSNRAALILNLCTWILSFAVTFPYVYHVGLVPTEHCSIKFCDEQWEEGSHRLWFSILTLMLQFFLPFLAVTFFYGAVFWKLNEQREKRQQHSIELRPVGKVAETAKATTTTTTNNNNNNITNCPKQDAAISRPLTMGQLLKQVFLAREDEIEFGCCCSREIMQPNEQLLPTNRQPDEHSNCVGPLPRGLSAGPIQSEKNIHQPPESPTIISVAASSVSIMGGVGGALTQISQYDAAPCESPEPGGKQPLASRHRDRSRQHNFRRNSNNTNNGSRGSGSARSSINCLSDHHLDHQLEPEGPTNLKRATSYASDQAVQNVQEEPFHSTVGGASSMRQLGASNLGTFIVHRLDCKYYSAATIGQVGQSLQQHQSAPIRKTTSTVAISGVNDIFALKERRLRDRNRRHRQTNRKLLFIVALFVGSWLPLNCFNLLQDYFDSISESPYVKHYFLTVHVIACSSVCYNPILYAWMSDNYRQEMQNIMPRFFMIIVNNILD